MNTSSQGCDNSLNQINFTIGSNSNIEQNNLQRNLQTNSITQNLQSNLQTNYSTTQNLQSNLQTSYITQNLQSNLQLEIKSQEVLQNTINTNENVLLGIELTNTDVYLDEFHDQIINLEEPIQLKSNYKIPKKQFIKENNKNKNEDFVKKKFKKQKIDFQEKIIINKDYVNIKNEHTLFYILTNYNQNTSKNFQKNSREIIKIYFKNFHKNIKYLNELQISNLIKILDEFEEIEFSNKKEFYNFKNFLNQFLNNLNNKIDSKILTNYLKQSNIMRAVTSLLKVMTCHS
jgi:hypothetical protein